MPRFRRTLLTALMLAVVSPLSALAQPYLVDTGQPTGTGGNGLGLFASGSTTCSPQPSCSQSFQSVGGQFTLAEAATIDSIEAWLQFSTAGTIRVSIRTDVNGLPGTDSPRVLRIGSVFSNTINRPPDSTTAG